MTSQKDIGKANEMRLGTLSKRSVGSVSERTVDIVVTVTYHKDVTHGLASHLDKNAGGNIDGGWQHHQIRIFKQDCSMTQFCNVTQLQLIYDRRHHGNF